MPTDVVRAYKGALKEKEALESTLKALSVQQEDTAGDEEGAVANDAPDSSQQKEEVQGKSHYHYYYFQIMPTSLGRLNNYPTRSLKRYKRLLPVNENPIKLGSEFCWFQIPDVPPCCTTVEPLNKGYSLFLSHAFK